jgi:hypothetical protein
MKKIKLSRGKYTLVDDEDYEYLSQWKWFWLNPGYAARTIRTGKSFRKILMHRLLLNAVKGQEVDHKNANGIDNRRKNLRLCSKMQNHWNRGKSRVNTSGYKGVNWNKHWKIWTARITVNGKRIFLGNFKDKKLAAEAYYKAAIKYHKEFARI